MAIRHIVFDIGKVLVHYDPQLPYRRLIPDEAERAWFFAHVCSHDWNLEQDRGRDWRAAEALLIEAHPDHADNIRAFRRYWREMVPHPIDGTVALFHGLIDAGHDVTMLTNFAADTFSEAREMFPFLNRPRGVTVSGEIGLLKPEKAIYDRHAEDFGLDPETTVFIDDTLVNVEGATAAGWAEALHFTGPEKLRSDLRALGLIG